MKQDSYKIYIEVHPEIYERYRERLHNRSLKTYGHRSKIMPVSSCIFEYSLDTMPDHVLDKIINAVVGEKTYTEAKEMING